MKGANSSYFGNIKEGISSLFAGLAITLNHIWEARQHRTPIGVESHQYFDQEKGIVTLQYPYESLPVPDNGRYRLNNEIDDCIVCDLCAKICPVDCIEIEAIKSPEEIGKTSDGSPKRLYAAKFDIDMAKCCYCGLCTTVCPTECLTMTKTYDYSEFDIRNMVYHYTDLSPEQAEEKKKIAEEAQKAKLAKAQIEKDKVSAAGESKNESGSEKKDDAGIKPSPFKPVFKPVIKPIIPKKDPEQE